MKIPSKPKQHLISVRASIRRMTAASKPLQTVAGNGLSRKLLRATCHFQMQAQLYMPYGIHSSLCCVAASNSFWSSQNCKLQPD